MSAQRFLWKRGPESLSQIQEPGIFYVSLSCATRSLLCAHRSLCVPIGLFESAGPSLCLNFRSQVSFTYLFRVLLDLFYVIIGLLCVRIGLFGSLF